MIGRYEVRKIRGSGAHGVVYQAWDPELARWVAIKVPQFGTDDEQRTRRFLTEAQAAARLRHPRIVAVYDSGSCLGRPYLASEFVEGQTLAERIEQRRFSRRDAVRIAYELAEALYAAHQAGVVHRDVKPANVMLDRQGHARLMDFGLAKRLDQESGLTQDGAVMGTPAYLSPEQARGESSQIGPASDQYTLASVLFELLTGRKPFEGGTLVVVRKIASEPAPTLRSIDPSQDDRLEAIIQRALQPQAGQRYPTIQHFAKELLAWWKTSEAGSSAGSSSGPQAVVDAPSFAMSRRALWMGGVAVLVLALMAGFSARGYFVSAPNRAQSMADGPARNDRPSSEPASGAAPAADAPVNELAANTPPESVANDANMPAPQPAEAPVAPVTPAAPEAPAAPVQPDPLARLTDVETFPLLVGLNDAAQQKNLLQLLDVMLERGLKNPNTNADKLASDQAFAAAQRLAPREPRIAYARGLVLKKRTKTKEALEHFEQAYQMGGYPFLPAYQTMVLHKSAIKDYPGAADTLLVLAREVNSPGAAWPDEAAVVKTVYWLGQMVALHLSAEAISGAKAAFEMRQEELQQSIPPHLAGVYRAGIDEAQESIADAFGEASNEKKQRDAQLQQQWQQQLEESTSQLIKNAELASGKQAQAAELKKLYEESATKIRRDIAQLKTEYDQLQIDAAPAAQEVASAQIALQQIAPPMPNADGTVDPAALEAYSRQSASATFQLLQAEQRLQGFYVRWREIARKAQPLFAQYARIGVEYKKLTNTTLVELDGLDRGNKKLELRLKQKERDTAKDLSKQSSRQEATTSLRDRYLTRDPRAESEWIRKSIPVNDDL
ncbi:MAG TPA: serine/threonine-protein kinase [Planctomycetaceae bacterium]|nr:serine/threonine-protein kinase [Planctomycetaceae bacterium]